MPASRPARHRVLNARERFLEVLATGVSVLAACKAANFAARTAYDHRAADPEFAALWEQAIVAGCDALEDEAYRRAVKGWLEPRFHKGVKIGSVRKFSDALLMQRLEARLPDKYRRNVKLEQDISLHAEIEILEAARLRAKIDP